MSLGGRIDEIIPIGAFGALERASLAIGRLEAAVEVGGSALAGALIRRQTVAIHGGGLESVVALLLEDESPARRSLVTLHRALAADREVQLSPEDLCSALDAGGASPPERARSRLTQLVSQELSLSPIVRAAVAFGCIVSSAPANRETMRAATLASDIIIAGGGAMRGFAVSPVQLDAATRSAAVQLERSGTWIEWIRAWALALAREAVATERAAAAAIAQHRADLTVARGQHRVGATDAQVLAHLQSVATFTIPEAATVLDLSAPTLGTAIERLEAAGLATELTGQKRDRIWTSTTLMELASGRQGRLLA